MASRPGALSGSFSAAPGKRPVSAALRVMGLGQTEHFQRYRSVLNRAVWSVREVSHVLLGVLVRTFVPSGPLVIGVDEALERRWGKKIAAKGIYRDPVRSTQERIVKSSGLRGICLMLLVPVPWAGRVWALPFLSASPHPSAMPHLVVHGPCGHALLSDRLEDHRVGEHQEHRHPIKASYASGDASGSIGLFGEIFADNYAPRRSCLRLTTHY
jgi:hypothetical protein